MIRGFNISPLEGKLEMSCKSSKKLKNLKINVFQSSVGAVRSESTLDGAKVGQVSELGKKCVQFVHFFLLPLA